MSLLRISKHKIILIINLTLILSIFIISINQVFANEKYDTNTKFTEKLGDSSFKNIPLDTAKSRNLMLAAGIVTPTNTSFESAEIIQVSNTKKGNSNGILSYYYKFVPQVTGKYTITNYGNTNVISDYVNFSVTLYDINEHEIVNNIERNIVVDEASGRSNEIIRYKAKMSYIFIEGKTYYIVIDNISVGYKFDLSFDQDIEESKNELLSAIIAANKIHDEAVEGK